MLSKLVQAFLRLQLKMFLDSKHMNYGVDCILALFYFILFDVVKLWLPIDVCRADVGDVKGDLIVD